MEGKEINITELQKEVDKVNQIFDRQIGRDNNYLIDKKLFNLTLNFTINDWRTMRTAEYWETIKKLNSIKRKEYTLIYVKNYLRNLK